LFLPLFPLLTLILSIEANDKSKRQKLTEKLFNGYDYKKPPPDGTTVEVILGVQHIYFPDSDSPLAVMLCTIVCTWQDKRLMWNPQDYEGIQKMILPANHKLWKPQFMTNMDGKNHRIASTAHMLKGIELEVKEARRESTPYVSMYRRVELEVICEKESTFPTILKCIFHGTSKEETSVARWTYINGNRLSGFMDDNTTGTGLYQIESIYGISSGNYYNPRKQFNGISVSIRLKENKSLHWILSTSFLSSIAILIIFVLILPPSHKYINPIVMILIFLLIIIPSQLIFSIKTYSSFSVPSQTRIYALLFVLTSLILPIQHFYGSEIVQNNSHLLQSYAHLIPHFKFIHSKLYPYTKDFELPFIFLLLKSILVTIIIVLITVLFII
ncbi:hypothetical protein PENTCL1PPCAC_22995, partial [Pristionchus entomophagus]